MLVSALQVLVADRMQGHATEAVTRVSLPYKSRGLSDSQILHPLALSDMIQASFSIRFIVQRPDACHAFTFRCRH